MYVYVCTAGCTLRCIRRVYVRVYSRVYAERYDNYGLRLYITKIRDEDAGHYRCEADVDGTTLIEETRMFLYGKHSHQPHPDALFF